MKKRGGLILVFGILLTICITGVSAVEYCPDNICIGSNTAYSCTDNEPTPSYFSNLPEPRSAIDPYYPGTLILQNDVESIDNCYNAVRLREFYCIINSLGRGVSRSTVLPAYAYTQGCHETDEGIGYLSKSCDSIGWSEDSAPDVPQVVLEGFYNSVPEVASCVDSDTISYPWCKYGGFDPLYWDESETTTENCVHKCEERSVDIVYEDFFENEISDSVSSAICCYEGTWGDTWGNVVPNTCPTGQTRQIMYCYIDEVKATLSGKFPCSDTECEGNQKKERCIGCGDGIINLGEVCDSSATPAFEDYNDGTGQCSVYDAQYESGDLVCNSNCQIDTSNCVLPEPEPEPEGPCNITKLGIYKTAGDSPVDIVDSSDNLYVMLGISADCSLENINSEFILEGQDSSGECKLKFEGGNIQGLDAGAGPNLHTYIDGFTQTGWYRISENWVVSTIPAICEGKTIMATSAKLYNSGSSPQAYDDLGEVVAILDDLSIVNQLAGNPGVVFTIAGGSSSCTACDQCDDWFGIGDCDCAECHTCANGPCFFDPLAGSEDCVDKTTFCDNRIDSCSDYDSCECVTDECDEGNCVWDGINSDCCDEESYAVTCAGECGTQSTNCHRSINCGSCGCTPDCTGKICGDNGCSGSCGSCPGTSYEIAYCSAGGDVVRDRTSYSCSANQAACDSSITLGVLFDDCVAPEICVDPDGSSGSTPATCEEISPLYWANMGGIKITEADLGDNVLMMYRDKGTEILSYELKEKDPLDNDDIRVIPSSETFNFDGDLAGFVKINQSDMDKAEAQTLDEDRSDDDREFIFVVDSKTLEDGDKLVIQEDVFSNALPTATIIAPVDDASYTLDYTGDKTTEEIIFNQSSSDEDDDIKVQWSFGDGTTSTWQENCLTTGSCDSVTHEYDSPGTKNVILIAQEMERGQWGWDSKNIFVYGVGLQVFSVIDNPIATGRFVTLNANQSKVTNCTNGTQPGPEWYEVLDAEGTGSSHPLWCYDLPKGDIGISYDFILKWTLDEADEDKKETIEGFWSDGYGDVVEFGHLFPDLGVHTIKLEVGYIKL